MTTQRAPMLKAGHTRTLLVRWCSAASLNTRRIPRDVIRKDVPVRTACRAGGTAVAMDTAVPNRQKRKHRSGSTHPLQGRARPG